MGYYKETVKLGAFKKTWSENPDVQLLVSHEGLPLARTLSGTMQLEEDHRGLHVQARLDPADPDVQKLVPKMQRGDVNQMSFAFRAIQQNWDEDYTDRKLLEVSLDRGDVSVVGSGANPSTSVNVREFAAALQEVRSGATLSAATKDVLVQALQLFRDADSSTTDGQ
jgi:HK97 family phage prohead protease